MKKTHRIWGTIMVGLVTLFFLHEWAMVAFLEYTSEGKAMDPHVELLVHTDSEPLVWGLLAFLSAICFVWVFSSLFKKYKNTIRIAGVVLLILIVAGISIGLK